MYKKIIILCLLLIPLNIKANPLSLHPNFNQSPLFIPKGTNLLPLCANPSNPYCFQNWTNQAIPMVIHGINGQRNTNFFLPVFIPSIEPPRSQFADKGWKTYRSSISSKRRLRYPDIKPKKSRPKDSSKKQKDQTEDQPQTISQKQDEISDETVLLPGRIEIQHQEGTDNFRAVTYLPSGGGTVLNEGAVAYINEEDIEEIPIPTPQPASVTEPTPTTEPISPLVSFVPGPRSTDPSPIPSVPDVTSQTTPRVPTLLRFKAKQDAHVLPASYVKEIKSGCFVINKGRYDEKSKTEARFCAEGKCEERLDHLKTENITQILNKLKGDVLNRTTGLLGQNTLPARICTPGASLEQYIRNFNKFCFVDDDDFKNLFDKVYCGSCQKGFPPEIMLSMMSMESAGDCSAHNKKDKRNDVGLFQINANEHQCHDQDGKPHEIKTDSNITCFKNVINNMNYATKILLEQYAAGNCLDEQGNMYHKQKNKQTNESLTCHYYSKTCSSEKKCFNKIANNNGKCKTWLDMTPQERDSWRRGVSGYNGGALWVLRSIHYVRDQGAADLYTNRDNKARPIMKNLKITRKKVTEVCKQHKKKGYTNIVDETKTACEAYLEINSKINNAHQIHRREVVDWERLRFYYFVEKFDPRNENETKTGRAEENTVINVSHTEAVLGREIEGTPPGIVEIWSEYVKQHKPTNCNTE